MEETYTTKIVILRRNVYREHDSRILAFSFDLGKIDLVVRGTQKNTSKLVAHIEPMNLGRAMIVRGKSFDYLGGINSERNFRNIKNDLDKISFSARALNTVDKYTFRGDTNDSKSIFCLLEEFLDIFNSFNRGVDDYLLYYIFFKLKFLSIIGFLPEMYKCTKCGKKIAPGLNFFSFESGGVLCDACNLNGKNRLTISDFSVKVIRFALNNSFNDIKRLNTKEVNEKDLKDIIKIVQLFYQYNFK